METLYCTHCKKTFSVSLDDIRLLQAHGKSVQKEEQGFRFTQGCFFKEVAKIKRAQRRT